MKKKIALFAVAGMLTTATILYATTTNKKETKKETEKKESKCNKAAKRNCSGYLRSI